MPRTKKKLADWAKNGEQADAFSTEIADEDLEALIETAIDLEEGAAKYRQAKKDIRKRLEDEHAEVINTEGVAPGWVRVGGYRFMAKATKRAAGEVKIGEGVNFALRFEAL